MNKVYLASALSLLCIISALAQESKLVGTWIGTFQHFHTNDTDTWYDTHKLCIRIYKYESYRLKMKTVPGNTPSNLCETCYYNNCTITDIDDNTICFYEISDKEYWRKNDIITGMYQIENHYRLSYSNGVLHINPLQRIMIEYDKHGNFLKRKDVSNVSTWIFKDTDLYKEENDW